MAAADKAKFKVGDRVRFTDECPSLWWFGPHTENKEGVIVGPDTAFSYKWSVRIGDRDGYVDDNHIEPATITIQPGKFYKTRDGRKVGPMMRIPNGFSANKRIDGIRRLWQEDGAHGGLHVENEPRLDLVSEWVDEPTDTAGYTVPLCAYGEPEAEKTGDLVINFTSNLSGINDELRTAIKLVKKLGKASKKYGIDIAHYTAAA